MVKVLSSPSPVLPSASMSQSGLMVAALLGGFIVFLAMQGKLANYWSILMGGGASATTTTNPATTPSTTTPAAPSTGAGSTTPTTTNPFSFLGGTANPTAPATGGTGTTIGTGIPGLPNISMGQFFGLGGG